MKIKFIYRDESPFLMPGFSRYYEEIVGDKHIGMIHLAHKDWKGKWSHDGGKTFTHHMPYSFEMTITPTGKGSVDGFVDVSGGEGTTARTSQKPKTSTSSEKTRSSAPIQSSERRNGKSFNRRKGKR